MKRNSGTNGWRAGLVLVWLVAGARAETLLNETFDSGFPAANGWSVGDANPADGNIYWGAVNSAFGGEGTHSGAMKGYCAGVGFRGTTANPMYGNSMSSFMSKWFDLRNYTTARLSFWYKMPSIAPGGGDLFRVWFGNDLVYSLSWSMGPTWRQMEINLDPYVGRTYSQILKFEFVSDGGVQAEGMYLDDIVVTAHRPVADSFEPDGTPSIYRTITNGTPQVRNIHTQGNVDWVSFHVNPPGAQNLTLFVNSGIDLHWDLEMSLYQGSGPLVGQARDSATATRMTITSATLDPGWYFIRIAAAGVTRVVPSYALQCVWSQIYPADAYENDNVFSRSRAIANGETQNRSIHTPGDVDWARLVVGRTGARNVRIETGGAVLSDTQMWLYDSMGRQVAYNDNIDTWTGWSRITAASLPAGTYGVKVQHYSNRRTIGAYTLQATWETSGGIAADAFEPDDTFGTAGLIANGVTQNRTIHAAGNVDWARFVVPAGGARNVVVETAGATGDTQMWLNRGSTGEQLAYDDNSGAGNFSRISVATLSAGTYYVKIQENGNNGTIPAYTLRVNGSAP